MGINNKLSLTVEIAKFKTSIKTNLSVWIAGTWKVLAAVLVLSSGVFADEDSNEVNTVVSGYCNPSVFLGKYTVETKSGVITLLDAEGGKTDNICTLTKVDLGKLKVALGAENNVVGSASINSDVIVRILSTSQVGENKLTKVEEDTDKQLGTGGALKNDNGDSMEDNSAAFDLNELSLGASAEEADEIVSDTSLTANRAVLN